MNDFEDRLTSALRSAGDDAPDAVDLAPAARGRARARSRRTVIASVAAVVAVAGVVGGAALLGNRDGDRTAGTVKVSDGTHTESWRDLEVSVPDSWGYGHFSTWCIGSSEPSGTFVVERPGGVVEGILCQPQNGYGLRFLDGAVADLKFGVGELWQYTSGDIYPAGAWIGYQRGSGDNLVFVVTPDRDTTHSILSSVTRINYSDTNGCSPHSGDGAVVPAGAVRLCRYDIDGWLEQSEVLTGKDATEAIAALEAAPARDPDRMCTMEISGPTVQITSADADGSLTLNACQGFTWDGAAHELTADAIYWTLSPGWSGGVEGDVPMPPKLRQ
ncbi:hypothetical protein ISU10_15045 [Nocardioides agariphilus]|uniref:Uncharacterized protein n=1 Tax=Nocardioides agariphilus TaxID=433664 RepID=A0A930VLX3_9ACTN|nr:hypothetical protein [Nocardioides agariphilus]MBF4769082.1 hypothetical protein [Nocardioides agariphilus]